MVVLDRKKGGGPSRASVLWTALGFVSLYLVAMPSASQPPPFQASSLSGVSGESAVRATNPAWLQPASLEATPSEPAFPQPSFSQPTSLQPTSSQPTSPQPTSPIVLARAAAASGPDVFDRVVLDAGHGGHDEGATGPSGLHEKDLVLDVTQRLAERLRKRGVKVILTRDKDRFLSLEERTAVANDSRADLFVSIHANASKSRKPRGIETYFASLDATDEAARKTAERENSAFGAAAKAYVREDPLAAILGDLIETQHLQESSEFAKLAQQSLADQGQARSRGVKQAPFVVLMGVQMPAALVEIGFITNPEEEKGLRRAARKQAIADALYDSIAAFAKRYDARRGVGSQKKKAKR